MQPELKENFRLSEVMWCNVFLQPVTRHKACAAAAI